MRFLYMKGAFVARNVRCIEKRFLKASWLASIANQLITIVAVKSSQLTTQFAAKRIPGTPLLPSGPQRGRGAKPDDDHSSSIGRPKFQEKLPAGLRDDNHSIQHTMQNVQSCTTREILLVVCSIGLCACVTKV